MGRRAGSAADGAGLGPLPPAPPAQPNTRSSSLPETRGAPSALLPGPGGPAHAHSPPRSPRRATAAGSGTASDECESFDPRSKLSIPQGGPRPASPAQLLPSAGWDRPGRSELRPRMRGPWVLAGS